MMIQEAYVSLELAKMMAKAGFTDRCRCYYLGDDGMRWTHDCQEILPKDVPVYECPTQQMACEWLRQVGAYHIEVLAAYHFRVFDGYTFEVFSLFSDTGHCCRPFTLGAFRFVSVVILLSIIIVRRPESVAVVGVAVVHPIVLVGVAVVVGDDALPVLVTSALAPQDAVLAVAICDVRVHSYSFVPNILQSLPTECG